MSVTEDRRRIVSALVDLAFGKVPSALYLATLVPEIDKNWPHGSTEEITASVCRALGLEE